MSRHPAPVPAGSPRAVLAVMCTGYFLVLLDVTIVNVALPRIGEGLGAGVSGLQWVVDGYALALAALLLAGGTIGDRRGHKRVVLAGLAVFGLASIGCGLAPGVEVLIGARVVQGAGAALTLPGTLAIITRAFPGPVERARAIGIWAGVGSVALPAGPLLGGALVTGIGWRAVFVLNVPIVAAAIGVTARVVRESGDRRAGPVDRAGVVLGALLLAAVTVAVIEAGHDGLGRSVVVPLAVAAVAAAAFLVAERRSPDPMLPRHLFRRPAFSVANAVAGVMNLGTLGLLFLLTLYLQNAQHRSALAAGVAMLPLFAPVALLAPLSGRVVARLGPRIPMVAGLLVAAAGVGLLLRLDVASPYSELLPALLAWGTGIGVLTPAVVAAAVGAVDPDRAGLASGVNNTARQAGGAIGIAAYGGVAGTDPGRVVTALHVTGPGTAVLFMAAAVVTLVGVRDRH